MREVKIVGSPARIEGREVLSQSLYRLVEEHETVLVRLTVKVPSSHLRQSVLKSEVWTDGSGWVEFWSYSPDDFQRVPKATVQVDREDVTYLVAVIEDAMLADVKDGLLAAT